MSQLTRQSEEAHCYEFGLFRVDAANRLLLRSGEVVPLTSKVFDILLVFVQNSGRLLDKDEVMREVWPDSFVEEGNLARNVSTLRKALGENPHEHQYIVTVPGRGYRFVARVRESESNGDALVVEERIRARIIADEEVEAGDESAPPGLHDSAGLVRSDEPAALETNLSLATQDATTKATHSTARAGQLIGRLARHRLSVLLGAAALIIAASVAAYFYVARGGKVTADRAAINSVAIMPFVNVGADPNMEYLSDGITESLINHLSLLPHLKVKSRNSVFHYKGRELDAQAVGRELDVQAVLTGRIVQRGDDLSIGVELVDARDNTHLWGEQYERKLSDVLSVQREITQEIAEKLRLPLTETEQKLVNKGYTENAEAYQLYLKGRYFWNKRTHEGLKKGIEYFDQAIERDPNYALAYSGLSDSYNGLTQFRGLSPDEAMPKAKAAALKALEMDDSLAEAHASLAQVKKNYEWDWTGAEVEFKQAIKLNPNYASARQWYAMFLSAVGRHDEALTEIRRAKELDPVSLMINTSEGWILFCARRYDPAIKQLRKTIELDPNFANAHFKLAMVYEAKGMYDEAAEEYLKDDLLSGRRQEEVALLRAAYAASGWEGYCRAQLKLLKERSEREYVSTEYFVLTSLQLREREQAFEWLQKAYEERSAMLVNLKIHPRFDIIRSDPRFADLLWRMNLSR
jgi:TolB-like protein/DNA-binding winged helix-turn-helix (wHTH) protein/Flp pilus assembly protein TadD